MFRSKASPCFRWASDLLSKLPRSLTQFLGQWDVLGKGGQGRRRGQSSHSLCRPRTGLPQRPEPGRNSYACRQKGRPAEAAWHMVPPIFS